MSMKYGIVFNTEIGSMMAVEEDGVIVEAGFSASEKHEADGRTDVIWEETPLLKEARIQLTEYAGGKRREFTLPLGAKGTAFQKKVWAALCTIPYGETRSYKQIAEQVGSPKACRAIGMANHNNPIGIIVPCHRVVGSDGSLTGYAGGLDKKTRLLTLEGGRPCTQS